MVSTIVRNSTRFGAAILGSLVLVAGAAVSPAQAVAADKGLYGATDPTFTGVYNQSLAILGLTSVGVAPSKSAVDWLLGQQCSDGSFESYRADTTKPCAPADLENFTGPSSDSTAMAALALDEVGKTKEAIRAMKWLSGVTAPAGNGRTGMPSLPGAAPDTNSSSLGYLAFKQLLPKSATTAALKGYLVSVISPCDAERGGSAAYQVTTPGANNSASAQAFYGLTAGTPAEKSGKLKANPKCGNNPADKLGSYLSGELSKTGVLSYFPFDGDDFGNTAAAVIGFSDSGKGRSAVAKATTALKSNAKAWALKDGKANAGALGWLLMVSESTGSNEKKFGGINLVTSITKSEKK
jgi:hypothetical protein